MKKYISLVLLFLLFSNSTYAVDKDKIVIGYITDLSGKAAFWGTQSSFGAELAVNELQQQGKEVELIVADAKLDTKAALSETSKMLYSDRVDAVINDFTPTSVAISSIVKKAKKLFVYLAPADSPRLKNPYAFQSFLDYEIGCKNIAQIWEEAGLKKIGMFKLNTEFGELCLNGARSIFPDIQVVDYNSGEDIRSSILKMKRSQVAAFFQTAYESDMLHRLQVMEELNYHVPVGVPEPLITDLVKQKASNSLEHTTAFGYAPISKQFIGKVLERDPDHEMNNIEAAALAYTHVLQIVDAIVVCNKNDINCQVKRMQAVKKKSPIGFTGWVERKAQFNGTLKLWINGSFQVADASLLKERLTPLNKVAKRVK